MSQKTFSKVLFELKVEANRRKKRERKLASCILFWHSNMLRVKHSFFLSAKGYHSFMHYHSPVPQAIPALCVPVTNNAIWQMFIGSFKEGSGHVCNSSHHKKKLRVSMLLLQLKHAQIRMHIALHMFFMHAYCPMVPVNESKKKSKVVHSLAFMNIKPRPKWMFFLFSLWCVACIIIMFSCIWKCGFNKSKLFCMCSWRKA